MVYFCVAYFNELLHLENFYLLRETPAFWINCGNLIFYTASIIYMGSINYIVASKWDWYGNLISIFVYSFTALQYLLYIIALLCILIPKEK